MTSSDCPRFHTCNAALCPLGNDPSHRGHHRGGEPVCYYLRMSGKVGAGERFANDPAFAACQNRLPEITETYPAISKAVAQASKSGFPGGHLTRKQPVGTRDSLVTLEGRPQQVV